MMEGDQFSHHSKQSLHSKQSVHSSQLGFLNQPNEIGNLEDQPEDQQYPPGLALASIDLNAGKGFNHMKQSRDLRRKNTAASKAFVDKGVAETKLLMGFQTPQPEERKQ